MKRSEEEARRWLAQARNDLEFVRWVLEQQQFYDKGCFIAQQAAEKAVKAILYRDGARTAIGHSVAELLERAVRRRPELADLREAARRLDRFYIPTRYPNGLPGGVPFESFERSDLEGALPLVERIVTAADAVAGGEPDADLAAEYAAQAADEARAKHAPAAPGDAVRDNPDKPR